MNAVLYLPEFDEIVVASEKLGENTPFQFEVSGDLMRIMLLTGAEGTNFDLFCMNNDAIFIGML